MSHHDEEHTLLREHTCTYTNATLRRAFIVWMYCGHKNNFHDVCKYFHYLEAMEEKLPEDQRNTSRYHELNLFSNRPPSSLFLDTVFPKLYKQPDNENQLKARIQEIKEGRSSKVEGVKMTTGTTTEEILQASRMIRKYCKTNMVSVQNFLTEFHAYTAKCEMKHTIYNISAFIKMKMLQADLVLEENYPKSLDFLKAIESKNVKNTDAKKKADDATKVNDFSFTAIIMNGHQFSNTRLVKIDSVPLIDI